MRSRAWRGAAVIAALAVTGPLPATAQDGTVRTVARGIDAGTGGLEVGPDGVIYTSDFGATLNKGPVGTRVFRVTPAGEVREHANGLRGATGSHMLADGRMLQVNIAGNSVSLIGTDGSVTTVVQEGLVNPVGITPGPGGFYVANCGGNSVSLVTLAGSSRRFAADSLLRCPNGITLASDGNLYVANFGNGDVVRIRPDGRCERLVTLPGANNGHLVFGNGVLYVAGRGANRIFEVTLDGRVRVIAGSGERGGQDGPAATATLSRPNDLALSPDRRVLYINEVDGMDPGREILTPTRIRAITLIR